MGYSNYETKCIDSVNGHVCAYCLNPDLVIDDDFDDHGNYGGTIYYCTCEKAKLEQKMKRELESVKAQEDEIRGKYTVALSENKLEAAKFKLKDEIYCTLRTHMYGKLDHLSDDDLLGLIGTALKEYREDFS